MIINTNISAKLAANNLSTYSTMLQKSLNRLSSGTKIVNPSDDAGGLAVSMKQNAAIKRLGATSSNIANAGSYLQTQDGAIKTAAKVIDRISELKVLSLDVTKSDSDKLNYNTEFDALKTELAAIADEKFNGISLFGSSTLTVVTTEDASASLAIGGINLLGGQATSPPQTINFNTNSTVITFTPSAAGTVTAGAGGLVFTGSGGWGDIIGYVNAGNTVTYDGSGGWSGTGLNPGDVTGTTVHLDDDNTGGSITFMPNNAAATNVGNIANASGLSAVNLDTITAALNDLATHRADNGAQQSRLNFASELLTVNKANLEASTSRILDVDVAEESTQLARWNTLVQAGTSMLSQANQSATNALRLISG